MSRKLLSLLITVLLAVSAMAQTEYEQDGLRYTLYLPEDNIPYAVISGNQLQGENISLTIPSSVTANGIEYSVLSIGDWAFPNCTSLTSVSIPDSVTEIGDYAFYYCTLLTSVNIPDSVTEIGEWAFAYCTFLTSVNIPNSLTEIEDSAFAYCTSLTSVVIPDSVTEVGDYAFYYCVSLTSVSIPDSVTEIGDYAFSVCTSLKNINVSDGNPVFSSREGSLFNKDYSVLICCPGGCEGEYVIPDSVTGIGDYAFYGCASLTSVVIPDSVTEIGDCAFGRCTSLKYIYVSDGNPVFSSREGSLFNKDYSVLICCPVGCEGEYVIPDSVTEIDDYAFYGCTALTSMVIPDSITEIGDYAFYACASLISVVIPDSVTEIGDYAFANCVSLTSVDIPGSVTEIGDCAFYGCLNLTEINYNTNEPREFNRSIFDWDTYSYATLNVAPGGLEKAAITSPWMYFNNIQEKDFNGIEQLPADFDSNAPMEIYKLNGIKVTDNTEALPAGIYIIRQGKKTSKIQVK